MLLQHLQTDTGRLFHTWKATGDNGNQSGDGIAKVDGILEDYANLAQGPLALYHASFDPRWCQAAHQLVDSAMARYWVPGEGFCDTASDAEELITRPRDIQENATPSGSSMMITVLLKPSGLAMAPRYAEAARQNLAAVQDYLARAPLGFGQWLVALDYALSRPFEIAIVGPPSGIATPSRRSPGTRSASGLKKCSEISRAPSACARPISRMKTASIAFCSATGLPTSSCPSLVFTSPNAGTGTSLPGPA